MSKFYLGPNIVPPKTVKTGCKYRGTKFYYDIDLFLTCDTIFEAIIEKDVRYK